MRVLTITLGILMAGAPGLWAQNPLSAEVKRMYEGSKNNLMRSAEKVPEDVYGFKPAPTVRNFGEEVGHAAEWNMISCASAKGEPATNPAAGKTSKADLMAALKSAFDYCDAVYNTLTDASATQMADFRGADMRQANMGGAYMEGAMISPPQLDSDAIARLLLPSGSMEERLQSLEKDKEGREF